ncbi:hypothetical protein ACFU93_32455 [Streptomyces sp. NPDC057611]|uniref:hypothetical protein n=1 Tax=Streptomyces sp. NPDC057611 TaxID=3346182 RepID=UPI0036867F41
MHATSALTPTVMAALDAADPRFADSSDILGRLQAADTALRAALRAEARLTPAQRRERSAREWTNRQRAEEAIGRYNAAVDHVNRERGRVRNEAAAAEVRSQTCMKCFQMPAANGECGC